MNDENYMSFALDLAEKTAGQTSPNPLVGAVVVKDGHIVGFGAHLKRGEAHAEVQALQMAGEKAFGATVYVTLEPCNHYGKTPPCTKLLIERGVSRVVIACCDPNPLVAGKGIKTLQEAGVSVHTGVLEERAKRLNRKFFYYMNNNKPYVTLKSATSLDGKTATVTGESQWITGEDARADVHRLRHVHDGILVGVGTVIADDPLLTTRLPVGGISPIRVILDHHCRIPLNAKIVLDQSAPTWVVTSSQAPIEKKKRLEDKGVHVFTIDDSYISIQQVLTLLGEKEMTSLLVEGGAEVVASFIEAKAIQEVVAYIAPKLLSGKTAPTMATGLGIEALSDALELEVDTVEKIGSDVKIVAIRRGE